MARSKQSHDKDVEKWLENVQQDQDFLVGLKNLAKLKVNDVASMAKKLAKGDTLDKQELSHQLGVTSEVALSVVAAMVSLFTNLPADSLKPTEAVKLLASRELIDKTAESKLLRFLGRKEVSTLFADAVGAKHSEQAALGPVFPRMRGIWTRCSLVASFDREYEAEEDVLAYSPTVRSFVPLVSIQIDLDAFGTTQRISMGLTKAELSVFINRLQLAEKQLDGMINTTALPRDSIVIPSGENRSTR